MRPDRNKLLFQYAGFAAQLMVSLGLSAYVGLQVDRRLSIKFPLLVWVLPLLVLAGMILKVIKDTSNK
jgi:hypothetical protein